MNLWHKIKDAKEPLVMGIVNLTPDSFFDGGNYITEDAIHTRIEQVIDEGADIIDIGAYSTRPGAEFVAMEEEWNRLVPALDFLKKEYPEMLVSIDTFRAEIADRVLNHFGKFIVNDISGGTLDKKLFPWVGKNKIPYILMHIQGTPQTMQENPQYKDVIAEVYQFLKNKLETLKKLGAENIIIDLGFGFGKTIGQNYTLLNKMDSFHSLNSPILVGVSRKSMIYKTLDTTPDAALNGSTVLHTIALERGAKILRVHDVKEAKEAVALFSTLQKNITL